MSSFDNQLSLLFFFEKRKRRNIQARNIKVKVQHYLLFMFSPPKINKTVRGIKYICLLIFTVFYLIQPTSIQIIWFDFGKQNNVLPIVFYVPCIQEV